MTKERGILMGPVATEVSYSQRVVLPILEEQIALRRLYGSGARFADGLL
jgi:hypothetical protein